MIVAGHLGESSVARAHLFDDDPTVRSAALGALARSGDLRPDDLADALGDPDPGVRRRACELAASHPGGSLLERLSDDDPSVVEVAAFACGERQPPPAGVIPALVRLVAHHHDALVREAAVGGIGSLAGAEGPDGAGLLTAEELDLARAAVLEALAGDRATVRRRAVLALAAFEGDEVEAALASAATDDRDRQVRQAAEDLVG